MKPILLLTMLLAATTAFSGCTTRATETRQRTQMLEYRRRLAEATASPDTWREVQHQASLNARFAEANRGVAQARAAGLVVVEPKEILAVPFAYPRSMRGKYQEAVLYFAFVVDQSGNVTEVRHLPVQGLNTPEAFVSAARKALKACKFEPGMIDGLPAPFGRIQPIRFELQENASQLVAPTTW